MTMLTSEKIDLLLPALLKARSFMNPAAKDRENQHFKYNYATEQSWHDAVQPALLDHDLLLTFSVTSSERVGNLTTVRGTARVTHSSGQWLEVGGVGEGSDNADKGAYKAMTGFKKYCYALCFALPTTDDVEDDSNDKARAKTVTFKSSKDEKVKTQDLVNAELVAAGKEPVHNIEEKQAAAEAYKRLKALNPKSADLIKHNCGTGYAKMKAELDWAYRAELEGAAK
jgi:hypothetical protein